MARNAQPELVHPQRVPNATTPRESQFMNPMLNRPYQQPDPHTQTYDRLMHDDIDDGIENTTVTFDNPQGMATPLQQWTEAVFMLFDSYSLQQLPTAAISHYAVRNRWTVVELNPNDTEQLEYELETGTKFHLRIQPGENGHQPTIVGELFSFATNKEADDELVSLHSTALASIQVRMEFEHSPEINASLQNMLTNPTTRKQ